MAQIAATPKLARRRSTLLNEPTDAVRQMLEGLIETNAGLNLIEGHNVIVRADIEAVRDEQVAIISGARAVPAARAQLSGYAL